MQFEMILFYFYLSISKHTYMQIDLCPPVCSLEATFWSHDNAVKAKKVHMVKSQEVPRLAAAAQELLPELVYWGAKVLWDTW